MDRIIIGLTGAFASGTSFLAKRFFEKKGFKRYSLSKYLKEENENAKREELQNIGNELRKEDCAYLAKKLDDNEIKKLPNTDNIVIESIRNPGEIKYFREHYPEFILIGVFADKNVRWERVKEKYNNSYDTFEEDDIRDKGTNEPDYGQKISDCFFESDLIISNNEKIYDDLDSESYKKMDSKIDAYIKALNNPTRSNPTLDETLMADAYVSGRRSRCMKRKVGAVIVDKYKRILSSGFNGVPMGLKECKVLYGKCYRDDKREKLALKISSGDSDDIMIKSIKKMLNY